MLSTPVKQAPDGEGIDPAEVQRYFVKHGHYTAGTATRYKPSLLFAEPRHQHLATGFVLGMRFHSAPVIRLADAKPVRLGDTTKADGRWRLFAFADRAALSSRMRALCEFLAGSEQSPVRRYTPAGADIDSVIDVRAVFQQGHRELDLEAMPQFLLPAKGRYGLRDYEKIFCPDLQGQARHLRHARHRSGAGLHGGRATRPVRRRMCCRSTPTPSWRRSSIGSCCRRDEGGLARRVDERSNPSMPQLGRSRRSAYL